jgi:hypothetical protein
MSREYLVLFIYPQKPSAGQSRETIPLRQFYKCYKIVMSAQRNQAYITFDISCLSLLISNSAWTNN